MTSTRERNNAEGARFTGCQVAVLVGVALFLIGVCAVSGLAVVGFGYIAAQSEILLVEPLVQVTPPPERSQSRAYLGIWFLPLQEGARLEEVTPGSPAGRAGLEAGDVIREVDGEPVTWEQPLIVLIANYEPGDVVTLTVERDGETFEVEVELGARPPPPGGREEE